MYLKIEIVKKIVGIVLLIVAMWFGVKAIALSLLVGTIISLFINSWPNKKLLNYPLGEQLKDIFGNLFLGLFMAIFVGLIGLLNIHYIAVLIIQVLFGALIYIISSIVLKNETFFFLLNTIKSLKSNNKYTKGNNDEEQ